MNIEEFKGKRQGNCINKTKRKRPLEKVNFTKTSI
jgi:hypothetical protein